MLEVEVKSPSSHLHKVNILKSTNFYDLLQGQFPYGHRFGNKNHGLAFQDDRLVAVII